MQSAQAKAPSQMAVDGAQAAVEQIVEYCDSACVLVQVQPKYVLQNADATFCYAAPAASLLVVGTSRCDRALE